MRPPGVPESWEEASVVIQAKVLAFDQVCSHDEIEEAAMFAGVRTCV
jgi:hypothetical protein